jgi:hypothetical protein
MKLQGFGIVRILVLYGMRDVFLEKRLGMPRTIVRASFISLNSQVSTAPGTASPVCQIRFNKIFTEVVV